eukprot:TRINITY_DN9997_c0_g2_i1.p3 TRINITY_DN9997_c0_g2~~TRINITY_DN9997_c0_g2_i1.p3  ORF type:complete len:150 (+),score=9.48 TRINITY_DN9997_c0_g2_i1:501-950(+)
MQLSNPNENLQQQETLNYYYNNIKISFYYDFFMRQKNSYFQKQNVQKIPVTQKYIIKNIQIIPQKRCIFVTVENSITKYNKLLKCRNDRYHVKFNIQQVDRKLTNLTPQKKGYQKIFGLKNSNPVKLNPPTPKNYVHLQQRKYHFFSLS